MSPIRYFFRCADRTVYDSIPVRNSQAEAKDRRVRITKDVSVLRIDHISFWNWSLCLTEVEEWLTPPSRVCACLD